MCFNVRISSFVIFLYIGGLLIDTRIGGTKMSTGKVNGLMQKKVMDSSLLMKVRTSSFITQASRATDSVHWKKDRL